MLASFVFIDGPLQLFATPSSERGSRGLEETLVLCGLALLQAAGPLPCPLAGPRGSPQLADAARRWIVCVASRTVEILVIACALSAFGLRSALCLCAQWESRRGIISGVPGATGWT